IRKTQRSIRTTRIFILTKKSETRRLSRRFLVRLPDPARARRDHGLASLATECLLELRHVLHHSVHAILGYGVLVGLGLQRGRLVAVVVAPHRAPSHEDALLRGIAVDERLLLALQRILECVIGDAQAAIVGG